MIKIQIKKPKKKGQVVRHSAGRVCKKFGCKNRLSVYNSEEYCHAHHSEIVR